MRGRQKARVFPEPVNAIPIMSRPEKLYGVNTKSYDKKRKNVPSGYALKLDGGGGGDFLGLEELKHSVWDFHILKYYESPRYGMQLFCSLQSVRLEVECPRRRR